MKKRIPMVTKMLRKKEVELGYIQIPAHQIAELLGVFKVPVETKLNNFPARIDKKGRIWCREFLRGKFSVNDEVTLIKDNDFLELSNNKKPAKVSESIANEFISEKNQVNTEAKSLGISQDMISAHVIEGDCVSYLRKSRKKDFDITFFDPPYLQGKDYRFFDDNQSATKYWNWIETIIKSTFKRTSEGGAFYFMHREKNAEIVLNILRKSGWNFQNLIIWKKKTSAVPINTRYSKQYQIIIYAIKGQKPRVFNKVRIDPPPLPWHKYEHKNGIYLTDVWDDVRELTSGYFAGAEALRDKEGKRMHVQQTPVALLLRLILSSSLPGDIVFDPTAGTGTTLVVAKQLNRNSVGVEIDPSNVELIRKRLASLRTTDNISSYLQYYKYTKNLEQIWPTNTGN
jgi:site-specific DNA-methyltransferase (adenine-specific)